MTLLPAPMNLAQDHYQMWDSLMPFVINNLEFFGGRVFKSMFLF